MHSVHDGLISHMNSLQFKKSFGHCVRRRRLELGYSQEDFADIVGVHRTYQGAIERGERNISIDNLLKISDAFQVNLSILIAETES